MINLLPSDAKKQIIAARSNVVLFRYVMVIVVGTLFLTAIFAGSYVLLTNTKMSAENVITENKEEASNGSFQAQADSFNTDLGKARTIFSQEILYSQLLTGIGAALPTGVVLERLNLTPQTITQPIVLQAYATTNEQAISLKEKLEASPLFSSVTIKSIADISGANTGPYTKTVSITVTLNPGTMQ